MSDYATSRILNELINISVETYDEIGEAGSQDFNPYEMLEKMLIISRERVGKRDDAWDSIFWMDENCRPDLICREVNQIGKHI